MRISAPLSEDASLYDTHFVDAEYGWAVGAHGCIWHTTDGGAHWHQQASHVDVRLGGVWFNDRQLGWAVGGATQPYLWTSQGVVLRTTDGGQTWEKQLAFVPALERVKFFDPQHGVAWGQGSGGEPLGLFASDDGGRNWRPMGVGPHSVWWGGDFADQRHGIVVGPRGQMARLVAGDAMPITLNQQTTHNARAMKLSVDGSGWMVGEAGLIQRTTDGGTHWEDANMLPAEISNHIEWSTVATVGENIWIAGSPGSVVLHSPDAGKSWEGFATDNRTPLNQLTFVDESNGWAVGDLGTILHTTDGGRSWQTQRAGGERAAVLMILEDESELPLAAITKLAKCDGYRTVVHLLNSSQDTSHDEQLSLSTRVKEAVTFLGGSAVTHSWQFDGSDDNDDLDDRLTAEIVRQLRVWQPLVLIVPDAHEKSTELGKRIATAAEKAVTQAADETQFASLGQQLALSPWQVSRVYVLLPANVRGTHRVQSDENIAGTSLADASIAASSLLQREFSPPAIADEFRLVASLAGEPSNQIDDLAAGLGASFGTASRRAQPPHDTTLATQAQQRHTEKRRNLRNIFRASGGNPALLGSGRANADGHGSHGGSRLALRIGEPLSNSRPTRPEGRHFGTPGPPLSKRSAGGCRASVARAVLRQRRNRPRLSPDYPRSRTGDCRRSPQRRNPAGRWLRATRYGNQLREKRRLPTFHACGTNHRTHRPHATAALRRAAGPRPMGSCRT